jgi:hypothetical protein
MPVQLYRLDPDADEQVEGRIHGVPFSTVCTSPCDQVVDARGQTFIVAAPKVWPSPEFTLDDYADSVAVRVRPGRRGVRLAGFATTVIGALLVPTGILLLATADDRTSQVAAGAASLAVAGASLGAGITLLVLGRTRIRFDGRLSAVRER